LAKALLAEGHAVRGTTRDRRRLSTIESSGADAVVGDPDRVATLVAALDHVTVACILLGSATGSQEQLRALHGTRLEMLMTKLIDTTVRGVVYEARGSVGDDVLARGAETVRSFGERTLARTILLDADPGPADQWLLAAIQAVKVAVGGGLD
jgi:hypothetical protein